MFRRNSSLSLVVAVVCLGTTAMASAATLNPGDLLVVDHIANSLIQVNPQTGAQALVSSGGVFADPYWVAIAPGGEIYVSDLSSAGGPGGIYRINATTGSQTAVSTGGSFVDPAGIAFDAAGDLLVADVSAFGGTGGIIKVNVTTGVQTTISSAGSFSDPHYVVVDSNGDIYVADHSAFGGNGGVIRVDPMSGAQTTVASGGNFNTPTGPTGMAWLANGDLAVCGFSGSKVVRVVPSTGAQTVISSGGYLVNPVGIALDSNGDLLVVDRNALGSGAVIRIDPNTGAQKAAYYDSYMVDPDGIAIVAGGSAPSADLTVSGPMLQNGATYDDVTVTSGATLVVVASLTVTGNMTVQSGGVVTHASRDTAGLALNVTGTLDVQAGGLIDVNGRGLLGGSSGSVFGRSGEAFDATGTSIVAGAGGGINGGGAAGASYGGPGSAGQGVGTTNAAYGLLEYPRHVGAGGGGTCPAASCAGGGHGGGRIAVSAGTLVVNGTIRANGNPGAYGGANNSGGGSGGGILIQAGAVSGAGTIQAVGGNALCANGQCSGSGGGGRIAIYYDTMTFPNTSLWVYGGYAGYFGGAGTVYLKDNAQANGDLIVNNSQVAAGLYTRLMTNLTAFRSMAVWNQGWLGLQSLDLATVPVEQPIALTSNAALKVGSGVTLQVANNTGFDVSVLSGSTLTLDAGSALSANAVQVNGGTLSTSVDLSFPNGADFELSGAGVVNVLNNSTLGLGTFDGANVKSGTLNVPVGSRLDVTANALTVAGGVTLVKDGSLGASGDQIGGLTILSGGVVTHASRDTAGVTLNVTGTLDVQAGGLIDVNGRGLLGGSNGSAFGRSGEAFDANGAIVTGAGGGINGGGAAGASYGGTASAGQGVGTTNAAYGLLEYPRHVGAGGGGTCPAASCAGGGHGGGRIAVSAGTLVVNGTIRANGNPGAYGGANNSGGGSGGAILIQAGVASGSGAIQAIGGDALCANGQCSGGGSGGRIAIYYDTMTLPTAQVVARGGVGGLLGGAGTIYLRDNAAANGDLIIDNGGIASTMTTPSNTGATLRTVTVTGNGRLQLDDPHRTVDWAETIALNGGTLSAAGAITLAGATLRGVGTVASPLVNAGIVQPGSSPGALVCSAGYTQEATGVLDMEVASPSQFDHLHVVGAAQLDGECAVSYLGGYIPLPKGRYPLVSFGSLLGEFAEVSGIDTTRFTFLYADSTAELFADSTYVSDIAPDRGGSNGPVTVVIYGLGFQDGSAPVLSRSGESDIPGTLTSVAADGRTLTTTFDLQGQTEGPWDVSVASPGGYADTLRNGFTIEPGDPLQVRVDVVGPSRMRPNRPTPFHVVLKNMGNTDLINVPLWITRLPAGATVDLDFPLASPIQEVGEPDWSAAPLTLDGPGGKYLAIVIPRIKPGATIRRFHLTVPYAIADFDLDAALTPPWANGNVFKACLGGGGVISAPACMGTLLTAINDSLSGTPGIEGLNGVALWAKVAWNCEGAGDLAAALVKAEEVLDYLLQPVEGTLVPGGCEVPLRPWWQTRRLVTVVTSVDPNDKYGAYGVGPEHLIGGDQLLPYVIQFENLATATAPVQELTVVDALELSTLDVSTVSLGEVAFGTRSLYPPPGAMSFVGDVDLRPAQELLVRVGVHLDRATGVLTWTMTALDPLTGVMPTDPDVGFLPPDGDGNVILTVLPVPGLPGGTIVHNAATINFDGVPTPTPQWSNKLDSGVPASHVLPLPANVDSASFTVRWEPEGAPADLHAFSVYVSEDGGPYRPWRIQTSATADTIEGVGGRSYAFYSLAQDSSGNLEAVPPVPDAMTTTPVGVADAQVRTLRLEGTIPNPVVGAPRVWFTLPDAQAALLEVLDVAGRRLFQREVGSLGPGRHAVDVSEAARRPGLYFLRLVRGGQIQRGRMVVIE